MATPINPMMPTSPSGGMVQNDNSVLNKDDFLKLLIAQIKFQDPFSGGMDPEKSMSQMTSYSQLEQMINMTNMLSKMAFSQDIAAYTAMIGKKVTYVDPKAADGTVKQGVVDRVSIKNGQSLLVLDNQSEIALTQVTQVDDPA